MRWKFLLLILRLDYTFILYVGLYLVTDINLSIGFTKTDRIVTFCVSRNTNLKYIEATVALLWWTVALLWWTVAMPEVEQSYSSNV